MDIRINGNVEHVETPFTVPQAIAQFSPYGTDALICKLNGEIIRSIDSSSEVALKPGDSLDMYPLVIGG